MLRSIVAALTCLFVLSACGRAEMNQPSELEMRRVVAELANCGLPGSRWDECNVFIVHRDGSIVRIGGFDSELRTLATTDDENYFTYDLWLIERFGVVDYSYQIEAVVPPGTVTAPDGKRYEHATVEAQYRQRLTQH